MQRYAARPAPGFLLEAAATARARKREIVVCLHFANEPGELQTPEGRVQVQPGDAIVRDDKGRQWRVSRHHVDAKYEHIEGDRWRSRRIEVQALHMDEPFEVLLADRNSLLSGAPGDWLVDYGDGSLGVVANTAFASSYDLID